MIKCRCCNNAIPAGDNHTTCVLHRRCSRAKPCQIDKRESNDYWDNIDRLKLILQPSQEYSIGNPEHPRSTSGSNTGGQRRAEKTSSMSVSTVDKGGELTSVSTKEMSRKQVSPSLLDNTAIISKKVMKDGPEPCLDVSRQATKTQIGTVGISAPNPTVVGGGGGKVTIPSTPERSQSVSRGGHHAECDMHFTGMGSQSILHNTQEKTHRDRPSPPIGNANCAQGNINVADILQAYPNLQGGFGANLSSAGSIRSGDYTDSPPTFRQTHTGNVQHTNNVPLSKYVSPQAQNINYPNSSNTTAYQPPPNESTHQQPTFIPTPVFGTNGLPYQQGHAQPVIRETTQPVISLDMMRALCGYWNAQTGGDTYHRSQAANSQRAQDNHNRFDDADDDGGSHQSEISTVSGHTEDDDYYSPSQDDDDAFEHDQSTPPRQAENRTDADFLWERDDTSSLFPSKRVDPLIKYMASNMGLTTETEGEEEERQGSFFFASFDTPRTHAGFSTAIPSDFCTEVSRVSKLKESELKSENYRERNEITNAFKVSQSDFLDHFGAPQVDPDIRKYVKTSSKIRESADKKEDDTLREQQFQWGHVARIGMFQMSLLNSLAQDLRPREPDPETPLLIQKRDITESELDRCFATARLTMDMASRSIRQAIRARHQTEVVRRQKVLDNIKPYVVSSLIEALSLAPFDLDRNLLFGGSSRKTAKAVSKQTIADASIQQAVRKPPPQTSNRSRDISRRPTDRGSNRTHSSRNPRTNRGASHTRGRGRRDTSFNPSYKRNADQSRRDHKESNNTFKKPRSTTRGRGRRGF